MNLKSNIGRLRILALLEGISAIALTLVTLSKYILDAYIHEINYSIGMAHGLLFVIYVVLMLIAAREKRWGVMTIGWSFLASIIPGGTFVADHKIFKKEN